MGLKKQPPITVQVDLRPGLVSQTQQAAWRRFWAKLISDANHDRVNSLTNGAVKEVNSEKHR